MSETRTTYPTQDEMRAAFAGRRRVTRAERDVFALAVHRLRTGRRFDGVAGFRSEVKGFEQVEARYIRQGLKLADTFVSA